MTDQTILDLAYQAMDAMPDDDAARLQFYECVADSELFLLLAEEPSGDTLSPEIFMTSGQQFVLAFDLEDRLVQFTQSAAPYAALSGRILAQMLIENNVALGLNLGGHPSETIIETATLDWLMTTLGVAPDEHQSTLVSFGPPKGVPETLFAALQTKLTRAAGLADEAWVAQATYDDDTKGTVLAIVGAQDAAQQPLAKSVQEALSFSGLEAGFLDVLFIGSEDPRLDVLRRQGVAFEIPQPEDFKAAPPQAPGTDPNKPPKLR